MKAKFFYSALIFNMLFFLLSSAAAFAAMENGRDAFERANSCYQQGNFDEAVKGYESILEKGLESGNIYFNLGNCFFKKGELGKAILNYEKAKRLIPLDKDLEFNYEYARSLIKGGAVPLKRSLFLRLSDSLFAMFTINGMVVLLGVFYILILVCILAGLVFVPIKRHSFFIVILSGIIFLMGLIGLKDKMSDLDKEAIVLTEKVDARFEPVDKATTHFVLYEGMKVEVVALRDDWTKIRRQDGKSGWVQAASIAVF